MEVHPPTVCLRESFLLEKGRNALDESPPNKKGKIVNMERPYGVI